MSTAPTGGGLRKRRTETFVQIRSKTITDGSISYRALGVLAYLLDRPDGWNVSAENLMKGHTREEREGREAVRTALQELAAAGYYRLERRRLRSGKFAMGTAISEAPVESWAEQAQFFKNKPIPMVEQADGVLLVRYPDGTLQSDDFPPPAPAPSSESADQTEAQDAVVGTGAQDAAVGTDSGFPVPGLPMSVESAPGEAAPGGASPIRRGVTQRGYTDPDSPSDYPREGGVQPTLDGTVPPPAVEQEPTPRQLAFKTGREWITHLTDKGTPPVMRGGNPVHALVKLLTPAYEAGYTEVEVKNGLALTNTSLPSGQQLERALADVRRGVRPLTSGGRRRGRGPDPAVLRVNDHWDEVAAQQAAAAGGES